MADQVAELSRLETLQRERRLTPSESERLLSLVYRADLRARRLAGQIETTRAKLARLEARADG